ncbi:tRNA (cytosine-5-)-methyltransferase [Boothiomyces sp. JEL0866]|nr:tRNA (cytosine-5-)-methyltransferase [Boothiomyces sp. JEL0866]
MQAVEFFCGIGGLHYGLEYAQPDAKVVQSFDTNTVANSVYFHNFKTKTSTKGIDILKSKDIKDANIWLLSPPCQPYTSGGKRLDTKDNRTAGLLNLIKLLPQVKPEYFFLENVFNFEISESRRLLVTQLLALNYKVDEFLVSPLAIGIPNDRKRYYLAAKLTGSKHEYDLENTTFHSNLDKYCPNLVKLDLKLVDYVESDVDFSVYQVHPKDIRKRTNFVFDVVQPTSEKCSTFTKAYGSHHFFGSGSFLQTENLDKPYEKCDNEKLIASKPRFFTPTEIRKLHYFPDSFTFPKDTTLQQKYRLLGNSLNCRVVGEILKALFANQKRKRVE